jgi:hypothetical protein
MVSVAEMLSNAGKKMSWWSGFELSRNLPARAENYETISVKTPGPRDRDLNPDISSTKDYMQ